MTTPASTSAAATSLNTLVRWPSVVVSPAKKRLAVRVARKSPAANALATAPKIETL